MSANATLVERLEQAFEWGWRDPVVGGFVEDNTPYEAAERIAELEAENKRLTAMVMSAQHALDEVGAGIARRVAEERAACAQIADWYQRTKTAQNIARKIRARPARHE